MSQSLGDLFPEKFKEEYSARNIKAGSVIRWKVEDTKPPKIKRFVILGISNDALLVGTLYINTEINKKIFKRPDLRALHLEFKAKDRDYLEHDSYLDCSNIHEITFGKLKQALTSEPNILIGEVSDSDMKRMFQTTKTAKTITVKLKKRYGLLP